MRWLFVGEALVLRKARRILALLVLNPLAVLRRSRSFIIHHSSFIIPNWAPSHVQSCQSDRANRVVRQTFFLIFKNNLLIEKVSGQAERKIGKGRYFWG